MRIGIIGAGNMGMALAKGFLRFGGVKPEDLIVSDRKEGRLRAVAELGARTTESNAEVARWADIVFLAVKPGAVGDVLREIRGEVEGKLLVSVAAGVSTGTIAGLCGARIVRLMPNICAEAGQMTACYSLGPGATEEDAGLVEGLLGRLGRVLRIEEGLMGVATAICGSGPAFFLALMEAVRRAAADLGMDGETARIAVAQTVRGAAALFEAGDAGEIIRRIATKGGTTEEGLKVLEGKGATEAIAEAIRAAAEKAHRLELGGGSSR
jgi:pyrroline-5-carboxylate reductase